MEEESLDAVPTLEKIAPILNEEDFDNRLSKLSLLETMADKAMTHAKELKAQADALSNALALYMLARDCKSKDVGGFKYTRKQRVFSKVEDKEGLRQWIMDNDAVDLLMAVHPSKLTSYCNEQLEQGGETPTGVNPNFIKYYVHIK